MSSLVRNALTLLIALTTPIPTSAQTPPEIAQARAEVAMGLAAPDRHAATAALERATATARDAVTAHPRSAEAHYLLAVALGSRLEFVGMREKLRTVGEVRSEAERALELDPGHAGAHHVLGRLHGAAMRLNPLSRSLARVLLGASALDGASWDGAERHFLAALLAEPGNPAHAMELGAVYLDSGRPEMARQVLRALLAEASHATGADATLARARTLLARASAPEA